MKPKPQDLPQALHDVKNCLSAIRSGCILIEDAVQRNAPEEIQPLLDEMRRSTSGALELVRRIPGLPAEPPQ